jgi:hypothetical protein
MGFGPATTDIFEIASLGVVLAPISPRGKRYDEEWHDLNL